MDEEVIAQYKSGQISLGKLAELLGIPIEETKIKLEEHGVAVNLGVGSIDELLADIRNA